MRLSSLIIVSILTGFLTEFIHHQSLPLLLISPECFVVGGFWAVLAFIILGVWKGVKNTVAQRNDLSPDQQRILSARSDEETMILESPSCGSEEPADNCTPKSCEDPDHHDTQEIARVDKNGDPTPQSLHDLAQKVPPPN